MQTKVNQPSNLLKNILKDRVTTNRLLSLYPNISKYQLNSWICKRSVNGLMPCLSKPGNLIIIDQTLFSAWLNDETIVESDQDYYDQFSKKWYTLNDLCKLYSIFTDKMLSFWIIKRDYYGLNSCVKKVLIRKRPRWVVNLAGFEYWLDYGGYNKKFKESINELKQF